MRLPLRGCFLGFFLSNCPADTASILTRIHQKMRQVISANTDGPCNTASHAHTHIRLTAFFSRKTRVSRHQKGKPFWILLKQEMMGWQWYQLHHIQIIYTTLQTDNHASTSSLNFLWAGCSS